jgi:Domain of unknown function (DUF3303)
MTEYHLNPQMPKSDVKRLMDEFGARGPAAGEIAHYVRADGTGGYTLSENNDVAAAYADVLAYQEFMTFTITPVLTIDDAVGPIMAYLS